MSIEGHLGPITPREAEYVVAAIMRDHLGFKDAAVTTASGDGGVDVVAKQAVAQVKHWGSQVGRPAIQQLYGARGADHSKKMVFFCSGGYSRQAIAYANEVGVALFTFDAAGGYEAMNESAREIDLTAKKAAAEAKKQADREKRKAEWAAFRAEMQADWKENEPKIRAEMEAKEAARLARVESGDYPRFTGRTFFAVLAPFIGIFWIIVVLDDIWIARGIAIAVTSAVVILFLNSERKRLARDREYYKSKTGKEPPV